MGGAGRQTPPTTAPPAAPAQRAGALPTSKLAVSELPSLQRPLSVSFQPAGRYPGLPFQAACFYPATHVLALLAYTARWVLMGPAFTLMQDRTLADLPTYLTMH